MMVNVARMIAVIERTPGLVGGKWSAGSMHCTVLALAEAGLAACGPRVLCAASENGDAFMQLIKHVVFARYGMGETTMRTLIAINDNLHCSPLQRRNAVLTLLRWLRDEWLPAHTEGYADDDLALALSTRAAMLIAQSPPPYIALIEALNAHSTEWTIARPATVDLAPAPVAALTPEQVDALLTAGEAPVLAGVSG